MKVLVISGFLGAGKTTFIQELARRTHRDFVIYENEYGQTDIDSQVLKEGTGLEVWESLDRCICCTGKQDFATSVLTIANTLDPEYLVVEPTGVAKLSAVLDNVDKVTYERISLLKPVCIVDWESWQAEKEAYPEIFNDQLDTASTVVISKVPTRGEGQVEGVDEGLDDLVASIANAKPGADIKAVPLAEIPDEWFESLLHRDLDPEHTAAEPAPAQEEDPGLETFALGHASVPTVAHLMWLLDALVAGVFGQVARAKGFVRTLDGLVRFDVVARRWAITGAEEMGEEQDAEEAKAVFIGKDLERNFLREAFLPLKWHNQERRQEQEHHHDHSHCDHEHGYCEHDHHDHEQEHHDHEGEHHDHDERRPETQGREGR